MTLPRISDKLKISLESESTKLRKAERKSLLSKAKMRDSTRSMEDLKMTFNIVENTWKTWL